MHRIHVLPQLSLAVRLEQGCSGFVNKEITERNCPHDPETVGEWDARSFRFYDDKMTATEVIEAMLGDGFEISKIEHLLAFALVEKKKYPLALGSRFYARSRGGIVVPRLWNGVGTGLCRKKARQMLGVYLVRENKIDPSEHTFLGVKRVS